MSESDSFRPTEPELSEDRFRRRDLLDIAGKVASIFSHEIRNPLAAIFAGLHTLKEELGPDGETGFLMNLVFEEVRSLDGIVKRLSETIRPDIGSVCRIDAASLVTGAAEALGRTASAGGLRVSVAQGPGGVSVNVDPSAIMRVLVNLSVNIPEAPGGGRAITLGWRRIGPHEGDPAMAGFGGRAVGIYGEGDIGAFPDDMSVESLFSPLIAGKVSLRSLGLAVAREIVEAHGGTLVWAKNLEDAGAFEILLPAD